MVRNLSAGSFPSLYPSLKLNHIFIEVQLTHNIILVSGIQHNDSLSIYIVK